MDNSNQRLKGIGKKSRTLLSQVVRQANGFINTAVVQRVLNISKPRAKLYLSRWFQNGWIKRIRWGAYIPLEIGTQDLSLVMEDPWIIANGMFSPCYIGGWTAAHHWELTDQLFNDTLVLSTRTPSKDGMKIGDNTFVIKRISSQKMFGLRTIYRDNSQVQISDIHKTIVDILDNPTIGGGIRSAIDFLESYLRSPNKDLLKVVEYAKKMENKTIFKRLGYLLSILKTSEEAILTECKINMSKGYTQLDPSIKGDSLVKKWRLWVPKGFFQSSFLSEGSL